jgi:hypothetical protein
MVVVEKSDEPRRPCRRNKRRSRVPLSLSSPSTIRRASAASSYCRRRPDEFIYAERQKLQLMLAEIDDWGPSSQPLRLQASARGGPTPSSVFSRGMPASSLLLVRG